MEISKLSLFGQRGLLKVPITTNIIYDIARIKWLHELNLGRPLTKEVRINIPIQPNTAQALSQCLGLDSITKHLYVELLFEVIEGSILKIKGVTKLGKRNESDDSINMSAEYFLAAIAVYYKVILSTDLTKVVANCSFYYKPFDDKYAMISNLRHLYPGIIEEMKDDPCDCDIVMLLRTRYPISSEKDAREFMSFMRGLDYNTMYDRMDPKHLYSYKDGRTIYASIDDMLIDQSDMKHYWLSSDYSIKEYNPFLMTNKKYNQDRADVLNEVSSIEALIYLAGEGVCTQSSYTNVEYFAPYMIDYLLNPSEDEDESEVMEVKKEKKSISSKTTKKNEKVMKSTATTTAAKGEKVSNGKSNMLSNMMEKFKGQFIPEQVDDIKMTMNGSLCVETSQGWVSANDDNQLIAYSEEFTIGGFPVFIISKNIDQLCIGDIIKNPTNGYSKVTGFTKDGKIKSLNFSGTNRTTTPIADFMFGQQIRVVVNMFGNMQQMGMNPMMFAMFADKGEEGNGMCGNLMEIIMMQSMMGGNSMPGGNNIMGMMMMMKMMGGEKEGEGNDMMTMMFLSQMFGGGGNMFGNMFGGGQSMPAQPQTGGMFGNMFGGAPAQPAHPIQQCAQPAQPVTFGQFKQEQDVAAVANGTIIPVAEDPEEDAKVENKEVK